MEGLPFITHFVVLLPREGDLGAAHFDNQGILVNDLVMSFAQLSVNFHTKANQLEDFLLIKQIAQYVPFVQIREIRVKQALHELHELTRISETEAKRSKKSLLK